MANYYNQIRKGKTIRKRLEILLSVQPLNVSGIAANRNPEPYVYDQTNPDEVHEFFAAYLEIFLTDREEAPSQRRAQEEAKWHEVIDKLEERFILFKGKAENSNNSEITAVKATAKSDLDYKLKVHIKEREQEFKSIGVNAFHSVNQSPQAIATYITDKLEELRIKKKREQIQGNLTPTERAFRILEPDLPMFVHKRFFQAFVGYKGEELKKAIDDYEPQTKNETSSQHEGQQKEEAKKKNGEPLSDEFFEWFRAENNRVSMNVFLVACWSVNWNPFKNSDLEEFSESEKEREVNELRRKLNRDALHELENCIVHALRKPEAVKTTTDLAGNLIREPKAKRAQSIIKMLVCSPLNEEAKAKLEALERE